MSLSREDILEEDAQILYRHTCDVVTKNKGPERSRDETLLKKHLEAMVRRHGEAVTKAQMDRVLAQIDALVAEGRGR